MAGSLDLNVHGDQSYLVMSVINLAMSGELEVGPPGREAFSAFGRTEILDVYKSACNRLS